MKQLELELQKRLLIVEPKDLGFSEEKVVIALGDADRYISDLTGEKRELHFICIGSVFTEKIAFDAVERTIEIKTGKTKYINYKDEFPYFNSALESFISAIEAQGYYWGENPFKKELDRCNEYTDMFTIAKRSRAFDESESRTFNPEKTLIFKIL